MKNKLQLFLHSLLRFFRKQLRNPRKRLLVEGLAAAAIIAVILFMILSDKPASTENLEEGISYIKELEKTDTSSVEKEIKEIKKAERSAALESGELDVWQQFNDSVILGDSRAVGFSYFGFLEENRVFADAGATIRDITQYIDRIKTVNPSSIILCFGLNDISIGYWETSEEYIAELDEVLGELQKNLPDAVVYVNSTIPATDPAFERSSKWRDIPEWNQDIKQHCTENGIPYIDITEVVDAHTDLYDPDGIHMRKEFYEYWAIAMITEVSEYE